MESQGTAARLAPGGRGKWQGVPVPVRFFKLVARDGDRDSRLRHRPERSLAGCSQPVCVEWAAATLAFGPKDEPAVRRGERLVAYAGPYAICEAFRGPQVPVWKPKPLVKP